MNRISKENRNNTDVHIHQEKQNKTKTHNKTWGNVCNDEDFYDAKFYLENILGWESLLITSDLKLYIYNTRMEG